MSIKAIKQKHPLRRNGSSRINRLVQALSPIHFKLDDRTMQDLLVAVHRYSKMLSWFDQYDRPDGDWACFWETETLTYLAVLAATDLENLRKTYDDADLDLGLLLETKMAAKAKNELAQEKYRKLLEILFGMAEGLESRYRKLVAIRHPLQHVLLSLIRKDNVRDVEEVAGILRQLIGLHKGKDDTLAPDKYNPFIHQDGRWGLADREDYGRILAEAPSSTPREQLRGIFIRFYNTYVVLQHAAQRAFDQELAQMEKPEYEEYRIVQPHISLFIAFLRLFRHAQDSLNELVAKQLDFYYEQVLGLHRAPAVPDMVYLVFTLAKNFEPQMVTQRTQLFGGKNKLYETVEDWVVSQAKIEELKSFYLPAKTYQFFYDTSEDLKLNYKTVIGKNYPLPLPENGIRIFSDEPDTTSGKEQEVGFVIASPQLLLQEGKRLIEVVFTGLPNLLNHDILNVSLSTEKGWEEIIEVVDLSGLNVSNVLSNFVNPCYYLPSGINKLKIFLPKDFSPVVANSELGTTKKWPGLKISLKKAADFSQNAPRALTLLGNGGYQNLIVDITSIQISVRAEGVSKNLLFQTDLGVFDGTQQLMPFGPTAPREARFYVGFPEALLKKTSQVTLRPNWLNPFNSTQLNDYYSSYPNPQKTTTEIHVLNKNNFELIAAPEIAFDSLSPISVDLSGILKERDNESSYTFDSYDPSVRRGVLRFTFKGDLYHDEFAKLTAERAISESKSTTGSSQFDTIKALVNALPNDEASVTKAQLNSAIAAPPKKGLPNPPYTPTLNSIELDYYSSEQTMFPGVDEFYYLHPFDGYEAADIIGNTLFKDFVDGKEANRGHLYLGLSQLPPASNLSILFHTVEGTEQDTDKNVPDIQWACLTPNNRWEPIPPDKILSDTTRGLTRSGIVQIAVPGSISSEGNTILNPKWHWLQVTALLEDESKVSIGAFPNLSYVHAQAITARFIDQNTADYSHITDGLPAQTISKLIESRSAIKKIEQPFASFNGRMPESVGMTFYQRISERLRHRDRAVTVWDYEHLLLEVFPEVAAVKCIPHTQYQDTPASELAPGMVTIAVIPSIAKRSGDALKEPRFPKGDLDNMRDFLLERTPYFLNSMNREKPLSVINAQYEPIRITVKVKFRDKIDEAYHIIKLRQDIRHYLSPWQTGGPAPAFGSLLRRSQLIQFIEGLYYIDYVDMPTFKIEIAALLGEYIRPGAAHGILCSSSSDHTILLL